VKRRLSRFVIVAAGLALITVGMARADVPGYTFKKVAGLGEKFADRTLTNEFEVASVNSSGAVVWVSEFEEGGEGAILLEPDGKATAIMDPNQPAPVGGTWGGGMSNKANVNDAGNVAFTAGVDHGDGAVEEVVFYDKAANKWTEVAKKGVPSPAGGTIQGTASFATMNNANDIVFIATVDDPATGFNGQALFLWSGGKLSEIVRGGAKVGNTTLTSPRRAQIGDGGIITFEDLTDADAGGAYMVKDGLITQIATTDTDAPGGSGKFTAMKGPIANANGDVALLGNTDAGWGAYLYSAKDKKLVKIAAPGDDMPGGGKLANAESNGRNSIRIGADSSVLFGGQLEDGEGVYLYKDGKLDVFARTGQELKGVGTPEAMAWKDLTSWGLAYASNGTIAFPVKIGDQEQLIVATPPVPPTAGQ
jgi:hypothetical protein